MLVNVTRHPSCTVLGDFIRWVQKNSIALSRNDVQRVDVYIPKIFSTLLVLILINSLSQFHCDATLRFINCCS